MTGWLIMYQKVIKNAAEQKIVYCGCMMVLKRH